MLSQVLGGLLLGNTANLSDHDDSLGLGIFKEHFQAVDEVGAIEGIASDADAQSLAEADLGGLVDSLVGQGAGTRDDSDDSLLVNVSGHDANFALKKRGT